MFDRPKIDKAERKRLKQREALRDEHGTKGYMNPYPAIVELPDADDGLPYRLITDVREQFPLTEFGRGNVDVTTEVARRLPEYDAEIRFESDYEAAWIFARTRDSIFLVMNTMGAMVDDGFAQQGRVKVVASRAESSLDILRKRQQSG